MNSLCLPWLLSLGIYLGPHLASPPDKEWYYWPFNGPLTLLPASQPLPGFGYDFYWHLPAPAARAAEPFWEPPLEDQRINNCYRASGFHMISEAHIKLAAPRLPPSAPLFMPIKSPAFGIWGSAYDDRCTGDELIVVLSLNHHDDRVRCDGVQILGRLKATWAATALQTTLAGDPCAAVREAAAKALCQIEGMGVLLALKHAAAHDSDRDVRRAAAFAVELIDVPWESAPAYRLPRSQYDCWSVGGFMSPF